MLNTISIAPSRTADHVLGDVAQLEDQFARLVFADLAVVGQPAELIGRQLGECRDSLELLDVDVARTHSVTSSDVTPAPCFTRLERPHDRMCGRMKVPGGMLVLRRVAAADMSAGQADAQMHPPIADAQALLAAARARMHRHDAIEVRAGPLLGAA